MNEKRTWRRSSHSSAVGTQNCVEVAWRRSSHSSGVGTQDCVEVAVGPDQVGVRDSKNVPGPTLAFPAATWRRFLETA
jgi:uncharacterized protein DUF397